MPIQIAADIEVRGPPVDRQDEVLTPEALTFVADLQRRFGARRVELLAARAQRQTAWDAGGLPGFLSETEDVRSGDWTVAPVPPPLQDRRVEITGPVERKMMINALNSGAKVFMADFEDANSPTWDNVVSGQVNVRDAVRGELVYEHPTKGTYTVDDDAALLLVRFRGWHLEEKHVLIDGEPVSASLFDFGLTFFHNAKEQLARGVGPYYYLPKIEHHAEARLWDDVFRYAQVTLGLPAGTIKATVLIETLPAAFQMDEILWALREHIAGLNAGRWDYIFSCIKTLRTHGDRILPDRGQVTMTVPFMRAYTELLVQTCHKRGAFAMGGMSAFIPDRRDAEVTERALAAVREDKRREAADGCDGTWVAHPDLVPVAMEAFDVALGDRPNQLDRQRPDVAVDAADLLDLTVPDGRITGAGLRQNVDVGLRYLATWLAGNGAVAIHNLMEDAATAEISRSQVWQWIRHAAPLDDGTPITRPLVRGVLDAVAAELQDEAPHLPVDAAAGLFAATALAEDFPAFLTLPAYDHLTQETAA